MRRILVALALVVGLAAPASAGGRATGKNVRFKWRTGAVGSNRISITGPKGSVSKVKTRERAFARTREVTAAGPAQRSGSLSFSPYAASRASIARPDGTTVEVFGNAEGGRVIGNSLFSTGTRVRVTRPDGSSSTRDFTGPGHRVRAIRAANRALDAD